MNKKHFLFSTLISIALLIIIFTPLSVSYDPWIDYDEDGTVDYDDFITLAGEYGTSGNSTKNVNVTNWPESTDVNVMNWPVATDISVWYNRYVPPSATTASLSYNASGFGHLHVLVVAEGLVGSETLTVTGKGTLWSGGHTAFRTVDFFSVELSSLASLTATYIHCSVPSETFYFTAKKSSGSGGYIYLSFYLTWA